MIKPLKTNDYAAFSVYRTPCPQKGQQILCADISLLKKSLWITAQVTENADLEEI